MNHHDVMHDMPIEEQRAMVKAILADALGSANDNFPDLFDGMWGWEELAREARCMEAVQLLLSEDPDVKRRTGKSECWLDAYIT